MARAERRHPRLRLLSKKERRTLSEQELRAVDALTWHLNDRAQQQRFEPVEIDPETGFLTIFMTTKRMQRCLRESGSPASGEHYARACIYTLARLGMIWDTARTKKPSVPLEKRLDAERYKCHLPDSGGRHAQPPGKHSYWWPLYLVTGLPRLIISAATGTAWFTRSETAGNNAASLSALARCQALVKPWKPLRRFAPGSVQWAFHHSGPP